MRGVLSRWVCLLACTLPGAALGGEIFGTKSGKVYHTQGSACASAARISESNRVQFGSIEEAEKAGRRVCKRCQDLADRGGSKTPSEPPERNDDDTGAPARPAPPADRPSPGSPPDAGIRSDLPPEFARVTRVLHGGTLVLDTGDKAVLAGVTCPDRGQPCAKDAVRFLTEQTVDRMVRITVDSSHLNRRDEHGRAVVYLAQDPGGRDVAAELLFQGYAWVDRCVAFDRRSDYLRQEESAAQGRRGVWKPLEGNEGEADVVTGRHALHYHSPKCPHVEHLNDPLTLSVNEARLRRLTPCGEYRGK